MVPITPTDLILNADGSIYHLHLLPEDIADTILLVGDPARADQVAAHFDSVEVAKSNREFVTRTGVIAGKRISVLSTGIGTDNIDIVLNELDALVNLDLVRREKLPSPGSLNLIRIGTTGALQPGIAPGSAIISRVAGGLDGLYHFYRDPEGVNMTGLVERFVDHTRWPVALPEPYFIMASGPLAGMFAGKGLVEGITLSTAGFYGPQVRSLRLEPFDPGLLEILGSFSSDGLEITNYEMESSAIYALSALLGHRAVTLCVAVANRMTGEVLQDHFAAMERLITLVLQTITDYGRS